MGFQLLSLPLAAEADLVLVRQRTRTVAEVAGFDVHDQTRLATAVSEIARNAMEYGGGGRVSFEVEGKTSPQILTVVVTDHGPGIPHPDRVLAGQIQSATGKGFGIVGARRLVDQLSIESPPSGGVRVALTKVMPRGARVLKPADAEMFARAAAAAVESPVEELRRQNQELLGALAAVRERQEELVRLNGELEDTNRGVIALFAELDEKADHLRRADEMKTRFLSNMSHEFRTPLNAIRGLSNLLLDRLDGDLTAEQERQVRLVARAAQELSDLVDDLLDLAKVEAGKTEVRPIEFDLKNLLGALRGMLRPLWLNTAVSLVFEDDPDLPSVFTDEAKLSQILRNLISNALKFTEHGEVRVSAKPADGGERVVFSVSDTGIGIAPEDQERIFHEFTQLDSPLQKRLKGTGLGLPLSRKLAELLGGRLTVTSTVNVGSTFTLEVPARYVAPEESPAPVAPAPAQASPTSISVLVVEDSAETAMLYEKFLQGTPFQVVHANSVQRARQALARRPVRAIVIDILLRGEDSWAFLAELKSSDSTRAVPVIVITFVDDARKAFALGADAFAQKPASRRWLIETLRRLVIGESRKALIIDDDEAARYLLGRVLADMGWDVLEAADARTGVQLAEEHRLDAILLDLSLADADGPEVLARLRRIPSTADTPVVMVTSRDLTAEDRERLTGVAGILVKSLTHGEARARLADILQALSAPPRAENGSAVPTAGDTP